MRRFCRFGFVFFALPLVLQAQEVLRGEVEIDLEPVYAVFLAAPYPLDTEPAGRRALDESALFFSAMIYGWSFNYDIGERARGIAEEFALTPRGAVPPGDPGLRVTEARVRNMRFYLWTDYRLTEAQKRRFLAWKSGGVRTAQAVGYGPLGGPAGAEDWLDIKRKTLEDAARAAVRAMLRGSERNRPKEARGFISLAAFPRYFIDGGRWAVSARFRVELAELVPF